MVAFLAIAGALTSCASAPGPNGPVRHGSTRGNAAPTPADAASVAWDYEVTVDAALDLDVRATFRGPMAGDLRVDDAATRFVQRLELEEGTSRVDRAPAAGDAPSWRAIGLDDRAHRAACASRCTVRYHVRLRDAAKAVADLDVAIMAGGAVFAPPSTWLVRPSEVPAGRYRFHVAAAPPMKFATGVRPAPGRADTYEAPASTLEDAAFAGFGALRLGHVADPAIERATAPELALTDDLVDAWLRAEASAIGSYIGRPPGGHAMLFVAPGTSPDTGGKTLGGGGASIFIRLGTKVTARNILEDWVVAHELIHVAFPDVDRRYSWFSEGLATYVEPIARAHEGLVTPEKVWADMIEGLPQGMPGPRDGGLDGSQEWGRLYWGGALYFLLADVRIRERTSNARGLQDAVRAVVATGANIETMWPLSRIIEVGDRATGTTVMREVYGELGPRRAQVDIEALFRRLGVRKEGGSVRFDDAAPLAGVRDAILPRQRPQR